MNKKKWLGIGLFITGVVLLILVANAYSKPIQLSEASLKELTIINPKIEILKQGEPVSFYFHVFNSTGGLIKNNQTTGLNCSFHFYNTSGVHLVETPLTWDSNGLEMEYILNPSLINKSGTYPYIVWCNSTAETGYLSTSFDVTETGKAENYSGLTSTFWLIPLFFILWFVSSGAFLGSATIAGLKKNPLFNLCSLGFSIICLIILISISYVSVFNSAGNALFVIPIIRNVAYVLFSIESLAFILYLFAVIVQVFFGARDSGNQE